MFGDATPVLPFQYVTQIGTTESFRAGRAEGLLGHPLLWELLVGSTVVLGGLFWVVRGSRIFRKRGREKSG